MTDRELMQMALDALEEITRHFSFSRLRESMLADTTVRGKGHEAMKLLRARLAQPEPEPVAWIKKDRSSIEVSIMSAEYMMQEGFDPLYTAPPQQPERKLWLWKNFVDGRPEYWAFDNPYPTNLDNGDPQTLGQPCGYAIFKPSRDGSRGRTEEQVLREMESVSAPPQREWQGLTDEEVFDVENAVSDEVITDRDWCLHFARAIEAKLKEKNNG